MGQECLNGLALLGVYNEIHVFAPKNRRLMLALQNFVPGTATVCLIKLSQKTMSRIYHLPNSSSEQRGDAHSVTVECKWGTKLYVWLAHAQREGDPKCRVDLEGGEGLHAAISPHTLSMREQSCLIPLLGACLTLSCKRKG